MKTKLNIAVFKFNKMKIKNRVYLNTTFLTGQREKLRTGLGLCHPGNQDAVPKVVRSTGLVLLMKRVPKAYNGTFFFYILFIFHYYFLLWNRDFLCSPKLVLKFQSSAWVSQVLGLQMNTTNAWLSFLPFFPFFFFFSFFLRVRFLPCSPQSPCLSLWRVGIKGVC